MGLAIINGIIRNKGIGVNAAIETRTFPFSVNSGDVAYEDHEGNFYQEWSSDIDLKNVIIARNASDAGVNVEVYVIQAGVADDPEASAFFNATGITDATIKSAITSLVNSLKGSGIWEKLYAIYPFAGGNADAHSYNLKDVESYRLSYNTGSFGSGSEHSELGYCPHLEQTTCSGLDRTVFKNLMTSFNMSTYVQNNVLTDAADVGFLILSNTRLLAYLMHQSTNSMYFDFGNASTGRVQSNSFVPTGFASFNKLSTIASVWRNGGLFVNRSISSSFNMGTVQLGMNVDVSGKPDNPRIFSWYSAGEGLSDSEQTRYNEIVQDYQIAIGRVV